MRGKRRLALVLVLLIISITLLSNATTAKPSTPQITDNYAKKTHDGSPLKSRKVLENPHALSTLWNRTYGGASSDYAYSLVQRPSGGFVLVGGTYSFGSGSSDFWIVGTNSLGSVQWSKTYGGSAIDEAHSVTRTKDGGYAVLGTTNSFGAGGGDFWLVKIDANGNMLWNSTYGGAGDDDAWSIIETPASDLVLAGWSASFGAGGGDFWLVKTDQNGNVLWSKTYGGALFEVANSVRVTLDGGLILLGSTYSSGTGDSNFWLVKTDASGNILWNRTIGGFENDFGFSVVQTSTGYALAGSTSSFGSGVYDFWLVATDQLGNPIWNKTYGGFGYDEAWSIVYTSNRRFLLTGWTESFGAGGSDCWMISTDESGNARWNLTWGGTGYDYAYLATECSDASFAIVGETQSFGAGGSDFLLAKIPGTREISIENLINPKSVIGQGYSMLINVTVDNKGDFSETFSVSLYANIILVETKTLTLSIGTPFVTKFTWNTSVFAKGNYTMKAVADAIPGENNTANNTFIDSWVIVAMVGDITGTNGWPDGKCDIKDISTVAKLFGVSYPNQRYNPNADIFYDLKIDIKDISAVGKHFGEVDP